MQVFLDTEFDSFANPRLLSLGMVTANEESEFYAELDLASDEALSRLRRANAFVRSTVLCQWGLVADAKSNHDDLARRASNWLIDLAARTETIEIVYDDKVDADLLEATLQASGRMSELHGRLRWSIAAYLNGDPAVESAKAISWKRSRQLDRLQPHHALADARALREGFAAMHGAFAEKTDAACVITHTTDNFR